MRYRLDLHYVTSLNLLTNRQLVDSIWQACVNDISLCSESICLDSLFQINHIYHRLLDSSCFTLHLQCHLGFLGLTFIFASFLEKNVSHKWLNIELF